ncbi:GNAT family N-acetyltransferase [Paenibacillus lemnae]|uniref:GNAT family N-acetyltransferase n=1 Tax=Paenibacillus lemnae TaxID=1330551 RepID=A0A848M0W5_PAELE|nr:GNAT family N-acetyltransferase [Paenibacillus lemnae]NMO94405.1 GNAT family N-acetyltransferase [Paenibacillus lemnae]
MFVEARPDELFTQEDRFGEDEVPYNLFYLIADLPGSRAVRSLDHRMFYAQSSNGVPWLWLDRNVPDAEKPEMIRQLIHFVDDDGLKGICSGPDSAALFSALYGERYGVRKQRSMSMEAYACRELQAPKRVEGSIRPAVLDDQMTIARFLADFSEDGYGRSVDAKAQLEAAEGLIQKGGLHVWEVEGRVLSMAQIAHRSPRHGRINAVFTERSERGKGYAAAIVADLCRMLMKESLMPMLYADLVNPSSNRLYRKIGFVPSGRIDDIRFSSV